MKLYEFSNRPEEQQYQAVWDFGKHLGNLALEDNTYQLYAINDFFVEIIYSRTDNRIIGKNQFKQGTKLEKYLP